MFKPNTNLELGNQIIILPTNRTYERIVLHTKGPTCLLSYLPTGHINSLSYLPTGHINSLSYLPTGHTNSLSLATKRTYQQDIRTHCPTYQQDIQAYYPTHKQDIQTHCPTYQQDLHAYNPTYQQEIPTRCPTYQKNLTTGYTCLLSYLLTGHTNSLSYLPKGPYLLIFLPTNRTCPLLPTGPTLCREQVTRVKTQHQTQFGGTKDCTANAQIVNKKKKKRVRKEKRTQSAWIVARNLFRCDFSMFLALVV
jgi:hypothetical protein